MEKTQIGVDIGGTFTDIVVSHNSYISKIKVLSTPSESVSYTHLTLPTKRIV